MDFEEIKHNNEEVLSSLKNKFFNEGDIDLERNKVESDGTSDIVLKAINDCKKLWNNSYSLNVGGMEFNIGLKNEDAVREAAAKGDVYSMVILGLTCIKGKKYDEGLELLDEILDMDINDNVTNILTNEYIKPSCETYGMDLYKKSITNPQNSKELQKKAAVYLKRVAYIPEAADALAECLGGIDNWEVTKEYYTTGCKGNILNSLRCMSKYYMKSELWNTASSYLEMAYKLGDTESAMKLGECYLKLLNIEKAANIFETLANKGNTSAKEMFRKCFDVYGMKYNDDFYRMFPEVKMKLESEKRAREEQIIKENQKLKELQRIANELRIKKEQEEKRAKEEQKIKESQKIKELQRIVNELRIKKEQEEAKRLRDKFNEGYKLYCNKDYEKAFACFKESSELKESKYYLGLFLYKGYGCKKDYLTAFNYFEAAEGYSLSKYFLGTFYYYGYAGVKVDTTKAAELFKQYLKDYPDERWGTYMLGKCYLLRKENENEGVIYLQKSAEKGNISANYELGKWFMNKKDYKQAEKYLKDAADAKNRDACYMLGKYYLNNNSVFLGQTYLNMAGTGDAYYELGLFYKIKNQNDKSMEFFEKAAKCDHYDGCCEYAWYKGCKLINNDEGFVGLILASTLWKMNIYKKRASLNNEYEFIKECGTNYWKGIKNNHERSIREYMKLLFMANKFDELRTVIEFVIKEFNYSGALYYRSYMYKFGLGGYEKNQYQAKEDFKKAESLSNTFIRDKIKNDLKSISPVEDFNVFLIIMLCIIAFAGLVVLIFYFLNKFNLI